jgi:hypothetical protein
VLQAPPRNKALTAQSKQARFGGLFYDQVALLISFPNHLCLGAKPQAVLKHDKAKQQRHG